MTELTPRQRTIRDYFRNRKNWRPPTVPDAAREFGMTYNGIIKHLKAIRAKGYKIKFDERP